MLKITTVVVYQHTQCYICPRPCSNVSKTPIMAMGCRQCLPLSVVQLKGKHCRKTHCCNGVVDTFEPSQSQSHPKY